MDVTTIAMSYSEADQKYKEYLDAVKTRKEKYLQDLKKVYYALKRGKKVVDIYEAFKKTGVGEDGNPKLAISPADEKEITFKKERGGGGWFSPIDFWKEHTVDVRLPAETFSEWVTVQNLSTLSNTIKNERVTTKVPIVPAHLLPKGSLSDYYLLWEVDDWKPVAVAKDPFLLKRVNANTFIVFAVWDLTEIEQMVMKGL